MRLYFEILMALIIIIMMMHVYKMSSHYIQLLLGQFTLRQKCWTRRLTSSFFGNEHTHTHQHTNLVGVQPHQLLLSDWLLLSAVQHVQQCDSSVCTTKILILNEHTHTHSDTHAHA